MEKIIQDHQKKSRLLKEARKRNKNALSVNKLKERLKREQAYEVKASDFYNFNWGESSIDDEGFAKAEAKREARIELLEELIHEVEKSSSR